MPDTLSYRIEPIRAVMVYGSDHQAIGSLVKKVVLRDGSVRYGILELINEHKILHVPIPWSILRCDRNLHGFVANIDRQKLSESPHLQNVESRTFDDDFASQIDVSYGIEIPGMESFNDFA